MNNRIKIAKHLVKLAKSIMAGDWGGSTTCDICGKDIKDYLYDAKTNMGSWGTMCKDCWTKNSDNRLGEGYGQEYVETEQGEFSYNRGGRRPNQHLKPYSMENDDTKSENPFQKMLGKLMGLNNMDGSNKHEATEDSLDFECYNSFRTCEGDASTEMDVAVKSNNGKYALSIRIYSMGYWDNEMKLEKTFDTVEELTEFVMGYDFDGEILKNENTIKEKDKNLDFDWGDFDDLDDDVKDI